jgi:hypothetical protein
MNNVFLEYKLKHLSNLFYYHQNIKSIQQNAQGM